MPSLCTLSAFLLTFFTDVVGMSWSWANPALQQMQTKLTGSAGWQVPGRQRRTK